MFPTLRPGRSVVVRLIVALSGFLFVLATPADGRAAPVGLQAPAEIAGRVLTPTGPAVSARVEAVGPDGGRASTLTGPDGHFRFSGLTPGRFALSAQFSGHAPARIEVQAPAGRAAEVEIRLELQPYQLDPVVVSGTMREVRVSDSPVKVDVVSARVLERHGATSLMDAVGRINGLFQQVDCGVCYTNSIRINGMEGPYTAVLIDGMPIMGALASVYGLNGIHPSMVERLEILKGPQSTLYGTEAMGGVVNVITKDPRFAPRLAVEASRSSPGVNDLSAVWAPGSGRGGVLLAANLVHNDRFVDENEDGFSDLTMDTRLALFGKAGLVRNDRRIGGVTGRFYYEDRFGGLEEWTAGDRGSATVYGESVRTLRGELTGAVEGPWPDTRGQVSWAVHDQDSFYGDTRFQARQQILFSQFVWDPPQRQGRHDVLLGLSARYVAYDDETPATANVDRRLIPGVFVEDEVSLSDAVTLLAGLRADHHEAHGVILSPRGSLMVRPAERTTFRLNAGTGFRVVSLFTEDHAALTGAREVVIPDALRPERSVSVAANVNQVFEFGANNMMVDLDVFHSRFSNRILPDYDTHPNQIIYRNLEGRHAVSRGWALSVNQNFGDDLPLLYTAGITVQDVHVSGPEGREPEVLSPDYRGIWSVSYAFGGSAESGWGRLTLDYGGSLTGPMRLPEYPEPFRRRTTSRRYATHDLQATWSWRTGREILVGVRNLGDFTQGSPLIDPGNPFGEAFDTNYIWGPVLGRQFTAGVRWLVSR